MEKKKIKERKLLKDKYIKKNTDSKNHHFLDSSNPLSIFYNK